MSRSTAPKYIVSGKFPSVVDGKAELFEMAEECQSSGILQGISRCPDSEADL